MGNGAFQTLIVAGLFLLIAAVIFLTVLVTRRGRGDAAAVSGNQRYLSGAQTGVRHRRGPDAPG